MDNNGFHKNDDLINSLNDAGLLFVLHDLSMAIIFGAAKIKMIFE
jgi:hypothetical protein